MIGLIKNKNKMVEWLTNQYTYQIKTQEWWRGDQMLYS